MKNHNFKLLGLGLVAVTSLLAGCTSQHLASLPPAKVQPSMTQSVSQYSYLIGPGDQLRVFVWGSPELTDDLVVRPDGMVSPSLINEVQASGKTPHQLAQELEKGLSLYIRDPIVTVTVRDFVGPYSEQVRVIGEATQPQALNYRENMTLLDVLIEIGGVTVFADGDRARLIRIVSGEQKQYALKIDQLVKDGDINQNVDLLPGDIIIIPEAWF
uniref:XrtA/PEP-CTERM system exopolysaccharide export protein n=1 Tax=Thaumasiovibrio occultus TaxID=1891184 RepID=UPI000B352756|nr:XrtA/PEP-CTERM system exopolysaccharide export protein [Thaumasiovibrio occultus]